MAAKHVRVNIPTNPKDLLELIKDAIDKHNADPVASPLATLDMASVETLYTDAQAEHDKSVDFHKQGEIATETRDNFLGISPNQTSTTPGTLNFFIRQIRDVLIGVYKGNEQSLENWGFDVVVNSSSGGSGGDDGGGGTGTVQTGTLSGTVTESDSNIGLEGVNVEVEGTSHAAVTDDNGGYIIADINAGSYIVRFSLPGYSDEVRPVEFAEGDNLTLNVSMSFI